MLEYQNISPKCSKNPKNRPDFHFSGQKNSKTWSKFHQNDQKTDRIQKYLSKMIKNPPKFEF